MSDLPYALRHPPTMLLTSEHSRWALATLAATTAAGATYVLYSASTPYGPSGGSGPGLVYGIAGTLCMLAAAFLSVRKRFLLWRIGSAQRWMKLHIWLGLLAIPLILFHAGFSIGGALTTLLMLLFAVVSLSGIVGLALQQVLPSLMTQRVPAETLRGQIEHVSARLTLDAYEQVASVTGAINEAGDEQAALAQEEQAAAARQGDWKQVRRLPAASTPLQGSEALRRFYLDAVRPYLTRTPLRVSLPPDFTGARLDVPAECRAQLERLAALCEESRQLAVQRRLHAWLHNWLLIHAPLSFALLVLAAVHIYFALRY